MLKELPRLRIVAVGRDGEQLRVDEIVDEPTWPFEHRWFYGFNEDCFDPVRYIVAGAGAGAEAAWLDAWERLLCHPRIVAELDVMLAWGEADIAEAKATEERGESVSGTSFNENGLLLDTDALQLWARPVQVRIVRELELVAVR